MKKYQVVIVGTFEAYVNVEAENEEEATSKAEQELFLDVDYEITDTQATEI